MDKLRDSRVCEFCGANMGKIRGTVHDAWWCGFCGALCLWPPEVDKEKWFNPKFLDAGTPRATA